MNLNSKTIPIAAGLMLLALGSPVRTQAIPSYGGAQPATPASGAAASLLASIRDFRVPLHTRPATVAESEYGVWSAGKDYKASFHDGFAFYPLLGQSYPHNLPLRWHTESIRCGATDLVTPATPSATSWSDWRFTRRVGDVSETYDVLERGVEQTFTILQRPADTGDLTIVGKITTELTATARAAKCAGVVFHDVSGTAILEYGAAKAIDAAGREVPVPTAWDGEHLTLTVPASWLATATWPVVVDPLTTAVTIGTSPIFGRAWWPSTAFDTVANEMMLSFSRIFSATDYDSYAYLCTPDFSAPQPVFADLSTAWSNAFSDCAIHGPTRRWCLAVQRDAVGLAYSQIQVYNHACSNHVLNSGTVFDMPRPIGETHRYPSVGGVRADASGGSTCLVTFQSDVTSNQSNTNVSIAYGFLFDMNYSTTFAGRFYVDPIAGNSSLWDTEKPSVNHVKYDDQSAWVVAASQKFNAAPGQHFTTLISQVDALGTGTAWFLANPTSPWPDAIRPRIDGWAGRYLVSLAMSNDPNRDFGIEVWANRFDWPDHVPTPTTLGTSRIQSVLPNAGGLVPGGVAYDFTTASHWAIGIQLNALGNLGDVYVARCGSKAEVLENTLVAFGGTTQFYSPAVTFDPTNGRFPLVYVSSEPANPVYGNLFLYPPQSTYSYYGTACSGFIAVNQRPHAGSDYFTISINGGAGTAGQPCTLMLGGSAANVDLTSAGMTGCSLLVATPTVDIPGVLNVSSGCPFTIPLPAALAWPSGGDVFAQGLVAKPSAPWPLKAATTDAVKVSIH